MGNKYKERVETYKLLAKEISCINFHNMISRRNYKASIATLYVSADIYIEF
jgi:hypothetical protein